MSSIPYALHSVSLLGYVFHRAGSIFPPLESEHVCDYAVVTLGHKSIVLSHKNITHFHLVLLEFSCLTQAPYSEEAQRAMIKQFMWRRTKTSSPQLHSAPASPCEWAPFKVDLLAPSWTSSTGTLWNKVKSSSPKSALIPDACTYVASHLFLPTLNKKFQENKCFACVTPCSILHPSNSAFLYSRCSRSVCWMNPWIDELASVLQTRLWTQLRPTSTYNSSSRTAVFPNRWTWFPRRPLHLPWHVSPGPWKLFFPLLDIYPELQAQE